MQLQIDTDYEGQFAQHHQTWCMGSMCIHYSLNVIWWTQRSISAANILHAMPFLSNDIFAYGSYFRQWFRRVASFIDTNRGCALVMDRRTSFFVHTRTLSFKWQDLIASASAEDIAYASGRRCNYSTKPVFANAIQCVCVHGDRWRNQITANQSLILR